MSNPVLTHFLAQAPGGGGSATGTIIMMVLFMGAMYFLMIAPQRKRMKEHQKMLEALKPGDEIITSGGIFGSIQQVRTDRYVVKIAESTRIEITKASVQARVDSSAPAAATEKKH